MDNKPAGLTPFQERQAADIEQAVFTIYGKHHGVDDTQHPVLYDVEYEDGQIDYAEDSKDACAKLSFFRGKKRYFVKTGFGGQLYNPLGLYEEGKGTNAKNMGRSQYEWSEVNPQCFRFYLEFLKTKVRRYLLNAQNEVI